MYIALPTGTGKGVILAAVAAREQDAGRTLVLIHRQEIALQLVNTLRDMNLTVGLLMQGHKELNAPITVATVQSLTPTKLEALIVASDVPIATILIDEAHHAVEGSAYERIVTLLEAVDEELQVVTLGVTATPYRSDKKSMLSVLSTCVFERTILDMVRAGRLAPLVWEPIKVNIALEDVATARQFGELDYAEDSLTHELLREAISQDIARQAVARIGQRPTLVFGVTVAHAEQLTLHFQQCGRRAVALSGKTSRNEREDILARWRSGEIQVVCNCALLTEGFDFPELAALVIARPTLSPSYYMQMLGRGTRPAQGKKDCLVLDVMGNQPDTSQQVVLPLVVGVAEEKFGGETEHRRVTDPILKAVLGAEAEPGLSLLDPIGQSHYRWTAYRNGYFSMVSKQEAAIIERDPKGSGLYHSRLYTMPRGQLPEHRWIEKAYLPLRQQVALVHEYTGTIYVQSLGSKEARWLDEPASEKQLAALQKLHPGLARQARAKGWNKRMASDAITFCLLRKTLLHPPDE